MMYFLLLFILNKTIYRSYYEYELLTDFIKHSDKPRIFSAFTYKSEAYMLAFQIKYLYPFISKFVLVSANISFTGKPLPPPSFSPFEDFLAPFFQNETIFFFEADMNNRSICNASFWYDSEKNKPTFFRKCILTSHILPAVIAAGIKENDFFYYADVDEFPTIETVQYLILHPPKDHVHMKCLFFYHFTFRWSMERFWAKLVYIRFTKKLKGSDVVEFRYHNYNISKSKFTHMIHMSSNFQKTEQFLLKVNSYCYTQIVNYYSNRNNCDLYIQIIKTLLPKEWRFHKYNNVFPPRILNDPSLKILFSPYPIDELHKYFLKNCSKQRKSKEFQLFEEKINNTARFLLRDKM